MSLLLAPAIGLMRRLRLLPKFALVALLFVAPLLLVVALLFTALQSSIADTVQERQGVRHMRQLQEAERLLQQHRALRHMSLSGNADAGVKAAHARDAFTRQLAEMEEIGAAPGAKEAWAGIRQDWAALQKRMAAAKAKDSYEEHSALLEKLRALMRLTADKSGLAMDPEATSAHLAQVFLHDIPGIADALSQVAGRGAAYIDTGLLEANEDVMLNSTVMVVRRDLAQVPVQFDAVFRENPALKQQLEPRLGSIVSARAFLERAQNEVLNSFNQSSGNQFFAAGSKSIDGLYASANATASVLDGLLEQRIARHVLKRNLIGAAVLGALLAAAYLLAGFYASFATAVARLEQAVERAAGGDLASRISSDARDEIGRLVNAFGNMNEGLARMVADVRNSSAGIRQASEGIAADNAELSARTESQASSLQQTASSMEELTSTVKQNGQNAAEANMLVNSAADIARKGGAAVGQVIDTMGAIKNSSQRVMDIIRVIDELAFQTNLLALNAAVEAARAGEQGRGFAVVAAEVRALAQRSAGAAKEIKTLIESSVSQIDKGNKLVDAAGATMGEIVAAVEHVAGIMNEISAASGEQTVGIEQVNHAISQMDEVTQRNALMVEQAAAAAESLQEEAARLWEAVSVFKLEHGETVAATTAPMATVTRLPKSRALPRPRVVHSDTREVLIAERRA
jgi:methyl-accepting chemotaxis protein